MADTRSLVIREQMLVQKDKKEWQNLLNAAPFALSQMACCYTVTRLKGSGDIKPKSLQFVQHDLQTSIAICHDDGVSAFTEAKEGMHEISLEIDNLLEPESGVLDAIKSCLKNLISTYGSHEKYPPEMFKDSDYIELTDLMTTLMGNADKCSKTSISIVDKFKEWEQKATKIVQAFTGTQADLQKQSTVVQSTQDEDISKTMQLLAKGSPVEVHALTILTQCLCNLSTIKAQLSTLREFFTTFKQELGAVDNKGLNRNKGYMKINSRSKLSIMLGQIDKISLRYSEVGAKAHLYNQASPNLSEGIDLLESLKRELPYNQDPAALIPHIERIMNYSKNSKSSLQRLITSQ